MPEYANIMPLINDEYKALLKALKSDKWSLVDLLRESNQGGSGLFNPVTFGDFEVIEGQRVSVEPALGNLKYNCTAQSLDYIFFVKPKHLATPITNRKSNQPLLQV